MSVLLQWILSKLGNSPFPSFFMLLMNESGNYQQNSHALIMCVNENEVYLHTYLHIRVQSSKVRKGSIERESIVEQGDASTIAITTQKVSSVDDPAIL